MNAMGSRTIWHMIQATVRDWLEDDALRLAAALSYYTIFSLAPLLVIVIAVAGLAFGNDVAREAIMTQAKSLVGTTGAAAISQMLHNANKPATGILSAITGVFMLLVGATGVVGQLQNALDTIWEIKARPGTGGIKGLLRGRILSLAMILGIGFLLLVSLLISAALSALGNLWGDASEILIRVLNLLVSIGVITLLFAAMFKFVPDVKLQWRNVWIGAFITSILFTIGKTLTGIYLAQSSIASSYGASGSLVVILIWVYYSSAILFLGAEFTQVYTQYQGGKVPTTRESISRDLEEQNERAIDAEILGTVSTATRGENGHRSPLLATVRFSGYQFARLQNAVKPATEDAQSELWISKWINRIVKVIGVKTSAKLVWKGYKVKRKVDGLTEADKANSG